MAKKMPLQIAYLTLFSKHRVHCGPGTSLNTWRLSSLEAAVETVWGMRHLVGINTFQEKGKKAGRDQIATQSSLTKALPTWQGAGGECCQCPASDLMACLYTPALLSPNLGSLRKGMVLSKWRQKSSKRCDC